MRRLINIIFLATLLTSINVAAESAILGFGKAPFSQSMETDRPDFTEGTGTVEAGHLQFELGYTYTRNESDDATTESHVAPELLIRAGLLDTTELRLAWEGYLSEDTDFDTGSGEHVKGTTDASIGVKHRISEEEAWKPNLSVLLELGLPIGAEATTADDVETTIKFLWAYTLNETLSIGGNLNLASLEGSEERIFESGASIAMGVSLTETIGTYVEYFGFYPESGVVEQDQHYANTGLTYSLTPNLQLDIRIGAGLNNHSDDLYTGTGLAFRL